MLNLHVLIHDPAAASAVKAVAVDQGLTYTAGPKQSILIPIDSPSRIISLTEELEGIEGIQIQTLNTADPKLPTDDKAGNRHPGRF